MNIVVETRQCSAMERRQTLLQLTSKYIFRSIPDYQFHSESRQCSHRYRIWLFRHCCDSIICSFLIHGSHWGWVYLTNNPRNAGKFESHTGRWLTLTFTFLNHTFPFRKFYGYRQQQTYDEGLIQHFQSSKQNNNSTRHTQQYDCDRCWGQWLGATIGVRSA